ncbi:hypothetical protein HanRHA438_Chr05g0221461 [Helianthus annuus]|nr:hypothetical protein HanIR_Chr05g0228131 [Helianthus annuus]KAJ0918741.1 hypothetical protein HanRHA438_Chr05g0221461 [Helianthus annuus]
MFSFRLCSVSDYGSILNVCLFLYELTPFFASGFISVFVPCLSLHLVFAYVLACISIFVSVSAYHIVLQH